jgi:hypothetical protein
MAHGGGPEDVAVAIAHAALAAEGALSAASREDPLLERDVEPALREARRLLGGQGVEPSCPLISYSCRMGGDSCN